MSKSHTTQGREKILKCVYNLYFRTPVLPSLWNITKDYQTMQEAHTQGSYTHLGFIIRRLLICYLFQLYNISMANLKRAVIAYYSNKVGFGRFGTRTLTGQDVFSQKVPDRLWGPHNLLFNAYWCSFTGVKLLTTHGCLLSKLRSS